MKKNETQNNQTRKRQWRLIKMTIELYLIRHGETTWNTEGRSQGQVDLEVGLTEKGKLQTEEQGKNLQNISFDKIYSSDLRRARETTDILLRYVGNVPVEYLAELRERCFGSMQGKKLEGSGIDNDKGAAFYASDKCGAFVDPENLASIDERVEKFIKKVLDSGDSVTLVVAHGWINGYIINALLKEGHVFRDQKNASVHYFKLDNDGKVLDCKLADV